MAPGDRNAVVVLGDQLDRRSAAFDGFDPRADTVWMAEVEEELTRAPCHKLKIAVTLSAMRHFRDEQRGRGVDVCYHALSAEDGRDHGQTLEGLLGAWLRTRQPNRVVALEPGDFRIKQQLERAADGAGIPLNVRSDRHFLASSDAFAEWAQGRQSLRLEAFYRWMRRTHEILLDASGGPAGERWNFDVDNRQSFGSGGPPKIKSPRRFGPDALSRQVTELVARRFPGHPGGLEHFELPVSRPQARAALRDFIKHRLSGFGTYQDAMWSGRPFLFHSRLSTPLNLHLLSPGECIQAAVAAWKSGHAPLNAVEGFVRQVLGWREFVRGVYWTRVPGYLEQNALGCDPGFDLPSQYWSGETHMRCVREAMAHVLQHGYAHHIERLMVLGLFALLLGVYPRKFHDWHMAMYLDAVDWASAPNALGMSQYADGGVIASKPYVASGKYVQRMSNFCGLCRYDPDAMLGSRACPLTTLYWDFLQRHRDRFKRNRRMALQVANVDRKDRGELASVRRRAEELRSHADVL